MFSNIFGDEIAPLSCSIVVHVQTVYEVFVLQVKFFVFASIYEWNIIFFTKRY